MPPGRPRGSATRGRGGRGRGRGGSAGAGASRRATSGIGNDDDDDDDELDDDVGDADFKPKHVSKKRGGAAGSVTGRARDKTRKSAPRLMDDPANDERELAARLKHLGLYAANTLGDGSCLFRSLSDQMHGTPNHHLSIRTEVCNFLLAHRDEFIAFIDDSNHSSPEAAFASHVAEMRMTATYGTQVEIVAFARLFKRRVKVIQAGLVYVIGFEDESPSERERRAKRRDSKGKMKDEGDDLPDLYIVYHNWEHYSSARNIQGPHAGLPCIIDVKHPVTSQADAPSADELVPTQEESLVLSSIRFPHRHTVPEIRKLIQDSGGSWETALEFLLENEMDETESEDFNNISPSSHAQSLPMPVPTIGITSATPGSFPITSQNELQDPSGSPHPSIARYSSASTTSSTATSATRQSASTSITRLSDLISETSSSTIPSANGIDKIHPPPAPSSIASGSSRVRSRANSTEHPDITAAESPRQRFRITREVTAGDDSSAAGDDPTAPDGSSVVSTSTSASSSASHAGEPEGAIADARAKDSVLVESLPPEHPAKPRRGRPPKNRDGLKPTIIKVPTRRQRKQ